MDLTAFSQLPWTNIFIAAGILSACFGLYAWLQHRTNPTWGTIDQPDATAFVKGTCGDSMKLSLKFRDGVVADARHWTDGCRMSDACGAAAAKLALNKSPEDLADLDYRQIEEEVGVLPEEDRHCATLAAGCLHEALRVYLTGDGSEKEVTVESKEAAG